MSRPVNRGDVYWVTWQGDDERKPWVIVSRDSRNHSPLGTYIAARLSTTHAGKRPSVVPLVNADLPARGVAVCDDLEQIGSAQISGKPLCTLSPGTMARVDDAVRWALDL